MTFVASECVMNILENKLEEKTFCVPINILKNEDSYELWPLPSTEKNGQ